MMGRDNIAWCPICFDSMQVIEHKNDKGMITQHKYDCFGCGKHFKFIECDIKEKVVTVISKNKAEKRHKIFNAK